ncbi:amidohydrolase [Mesorhizobium loti]|uniref:Amidohydrolase n=1 Tax=Mesorhizobium erdmanii TaxID=1777866 RepID=A0A6M7UQP3_9HYPH|nr:MULTISPECIES: M20 aminoacylase family protein [Mesorhizobium]OBP77753.1 amidohydrolase [Mesorhizobium loti]OBQ63776.1 amidohydrolase [Mesorhizobium loti]QKC79212.1 amidohydrolase [Mesorhizobium erdmanii]
MPNIETFRDLQCEATEWRRYLHLHPELGYQLYNTARFVAEKLGSFGINHIETGIAETGIVAMIHGQGGTGPTIGLRADMDALPILEKSNKPWSSQIPGRMHGCGHDGHTAMLLGAAKYLANTRNFKGSVALIFQPAEEDGRGGQRMVQEGIMDRFGISQVFGMHNDPGLEVGRFAICDGPLMAALDEFDILVKGRGGHAAEPHKCVDPIVIAAQIIVGLQTLVARNTNPMDSLVMSITKLDAGEAYNIIPESAKIAGTVRTLSAGLRDFAEQQIYTTAQCVARGFSGDIEFKYSRLEPVTINSNYETNLAIKVASSLVGAAAVDDKIKPSMGSEDFSYMLEARPGSYILVGNGHTAAVHNPAYDFNDEVLPYGIGYWVNLVETALPASSV